MKGVLATVLVLLIGLQPALLQARPFDGSTPQSGPQAITPPSQPRQAFAGIAAPSVEAMGVSFDRIKRILADRPPTTDNIGLKLNYYVEVVAVAPTIRLFTPADLAVTGPVPWALPTHAEIASSLLPLRGQYHSSAVPIGALVVMGVTKYLAWQASRSKREQMEAERKKRDAEERRRQQLIQDSSLIVSKPIK